MRLKFLDYDEQKADIAKEVLTSYGIPYRVETSRSILRSEYNIEVDIDIEFFDYLKKEIDEKSKVIDQLENCYDLPSRTDNKKYTDKGPSFFEKLIKSIGGDDGIKVGKVNLLTGEIERVSLEEFHQHQSTLTDLVRGIVSEIDNYLDREGTPVRYEDLSETDRKILRQDVGNVYTANQLNSSDVTILKMSNGHFIVKPPLL